MGEKRWHVDFFAKIKPNEKFFGNIRLKEKNKYLLLRLMFNVWKGNIILYRGRAVSDKKLFMKILDIKKTAYYDFIDEVISKWYVVEFEWKFYMNIVVCNFLAESNKFLFDKMIEYNSVIGL